jgi:hypothetical protein
MKVELYAPQSYWIASPWQRHIVANGCGPKGLGWIIPNWLWGCDITPACNIHDWMYHYGLTLADKEEADRVFLNNMIRIINIRTKWSWLRKLRLDKAYTYYEAVARFGGPAFWKGLNDPQKLHEVTV